MISSRKRVEMSMNTISSVESAESYFSVIEEADEQRLSLIDKYQINTVQYFPIFGFCKINSKIKNESILKNNQIRKIETISGKITSDKNGKCSHYY